MQPFHASTKFESNTTYRLDADRISFDLSNATRLNSKIYRAIYPSSKTWLDTAIYLKDLEDVTIDFGGATLYLKDDTIQPFVLDSCKNVTIKNVIVEYERSLLNEMEIVDVKDGQILCRQTEKQKRHFPMRVENGELIPISGKKEYKKAFAEPMFFNLYEKDTHRCKKTYLFRIGTDLPEIPYEKFPFQYYDLITEESDGLIVLRGNVPSDICTNVTCAISHTSRDVSSCFIINSKSTRLENVRILNGAGLGILGMYSENITLDGVKYCFDERSHGVAANAADAVHLISCFGTVEIVNSVFEGMKDDALNIHGNYYTVDSVEGDVIHARLKTDIQQNPGVNAHFKMFDRGDALAIYQGNTMIGKGTLSVEQVKITGDFTADISVQGNTSSLSSGDTIENLSAQADLHIKGCRFGKTRTSLRLQTRGKVLIEDCDSELKILLSGDKNYWYEGSPITDMTVQGCRFHGERARIWAIPSFEATPAAPYYHSGIKVLNNVFDVTDALNLSDCENVLFEGNVNSEGLPFENKYQRCTGITEK